MNESGGHRIQRIPPTERKGRVHTSTVTVAIIDPSVQQFSISDKDLRIEWYSGTGAGGQHRNKKQNSCRLTHIPTGVVSTAQCRSRESSYDEAFKSLKLKVESAANQERSNTVAHDRKLQVGSGQRGDKIRTYRFQDDTVCDHMTHKTGAVSRVLKGNFDLLW
jgi:peptide chain release factor 1